ncbi:helix-turn-helix domain-containing protein [Heyndrickxia sporothermodurans]
MTDPILIAALERALEHARTNAPAPALDELITSGEAAKLARVSKLTIRRWCERFDIGRKVAGRWRVYRSKLQVFIAGQAA